MRFGCTLLAVADMARAKQFYSDVFGLVVSGDFGANAVLSDGETDCLSLQTADTWRQFIGGRSVAFGSNSFELYFETADIDAFVRHLTQLPGVEYVHPLLEHAWGQRAVRIFDPDRHIIEVGEAISVVVRRFLQDGLTAEETAKRMDVPASYIHAVLDAGGPRAAP